MRNFSDYNNIGDKKDKDCIKSLLESLSIDVENDNPTKDINIVVDDNILEKLDKIYKEKFKKEKIDLLEKLRILVYNRDLCSIDDEILRLKNEE